jgi:endoglucanase
VSNNKSLFIENSTGDCNLSNYASLFEPKQGYAYQINGWMKGEAIVANAACRLRIDFLTTNDPIFKRNKIYLDYTLKKFADWGKVKNVPVYMGEFGAGIHCFQNNKGGVQWVGDMIDIARSNQFYFTYHTYHEDNFGLYFGYGTLPDPSQVNQPLIDLFKLKLK